MAQGYTTALGEQKVDFFIGPTDASNYAAMDQRKAELEAEGAHSFTRTKIGRNATCPCGSKLKFKKCCLHKATAGL